MLEKVLPRTALEELWSRKYPPWINPSQLTLPPSAAVFLLSRFSRLAKLLPWIVESLSPHATTPP